MNKIHAAAAKSALTMMMLSACFFENLSQSNPILDGLLHSVAVDFNLYLDTLACDLLETCIQIRMFKCLKEDVGKGW